MEADNSWKGVSIPALEKNVIEDWRKNQISGQIIQKSIDKPQCVFIDGPPFANGKLHWGHALVSTIKDTMIRFLTMTGKNVSREFGWDTHGVPMEDAAKKKIGYKNKQELLQFGIDRHNNVCREMIADCSARWQKDFERLARWVDPTREYKTMDASYMESVIWVFKQLFMKGMVYEGYKVMPYSTGYTTAVSHSESKQNYKQVSENTIVCCFEITSTDHSVFKHQTDFPNYILAWTTTPWTLPSNMAICTGMDITIVYVFDQETKRYYLMSNNKFEINYAKLKYNNIGRFKIIDRIVSYDLANVEYRPPFTWFWNPEELAKIDINERPFRVVTDGYVKDGAEGYATGFVHLAAAHGADDFRVCCQHNITDTRNSKHNIIDLINDEGCFTNSGREYSGKYIKDADPLIIRDLKSRGLVFESKSYTHNYPYCDRSNTPLIYRLVTGWFINASDPVFREKMLANNAKINWMPSNIGEKDFNNWLKDSVDWCVSRSRYWGTPIPIWKSDDGMEVVCVGSIRELEELSGITGIRDLHLEYVDKIKIPSKTGRGMLSHVGLVLDCWFESGCAPYGQLHYPFENTDKLHIEKPAVADFVAESKDQIRGWFYTLTVLATALFDKPAFQNVIVSGLILGNDGEKMSKSKGNYTDPNIVLEKFGADAVRLYLLSSPAVKAEAIKFDDDAIGKMQQSSIVKIYNIALLLVEKINLYNKQFPETTIQYPAINDIINFSDILDKWIINKTHILANEMAQDFTNYRVNGAAHRTLAYIEQLTNWYVKMARERLKGSSSRYSKNDDGWRQAVQTLLFVLHKFIIITAPIMPFITETVYKMISPYLPNKYISVHFEEYPVSKDFVQNTIINNDLENKFTIVQKVITLIREIRDSVKINHRRPVVCASIGCIDDNNWLIIQDILDYVKTESNVMNVKKLELDNLLERKTEANVPEIKQYLLDKGHDLKYMKDILSYLSKLTDQQITEMESNGFITEPKSNILINKNLVNIKHILKNNNVSYKISDNIVVHLDTTYSENVEREHLIRLINTAIQMHRKDVMLKPWDIIELSYYTESQKLHAFIENNIAQFLSKNIVKIVYHKINVEHTHTQKEIMDDIILMTSVKTN